MAAEITQALLKALEAGGVGAAPATLNQGGALQPEDLSPVMHNVTYEEEHIVLQKDMKVTPCRSLLAQFNRQLAYGDGFDTAAVDEGQVGPEETSKYVRIVVPMAYYSQIRRVTIQANMVDTFDGVKAEERAAKDAAIHLAGCIEKDLFLGKSLFSNAGVFDGNMAAIPAMKNMLGLDPQIRQSDNERNAQDAMFAEFGSSETVVVAAGGPMTQTMVEDISLRSHLNFGYANEFYADPTVISNYNKIVFAKEKIIVAGSGPSRTGGDLKNQDVSGGNIKFSWTMFLRGKYRPSSPKSAGPTAPSITGAASGGTTSLAAGNYVYYATSVNELGESTRSASATVAVTATQQVAITITLGSGTSRYFNVYRSDVGGSVATARFIGRVANSGAATTIFTDLNNRLPGAVTGFLVQKDTMEIKELAPYSRVKLAVSDLSIPEAHFRFCALANYKPRCSVILNNLIGG